MDSWQDSALEGVHRVVILANTVDELGTSLGGLREGAEAALSIIDEQVAILRQEVGTFTIENFATDLATAQTILETTALLAVGNFEGAELAASTLNTPFAEFTGYMNDLYNILPDANSSMSEYAQSISDIAKSQVIMGAMAGQQADKPSWWDKFKGGWKELTSQQDSLLEAINPFDMLSDFGDGWKNTYKEWEDEGIATQKQITDLLNGGNASFTSSLDTSMTTFKGYGSDLEVVADEAGDAASRALKAAKSAERSARSARASASSSASGALV